MITVKELIEALQKMPQDGFVKVSPKWYNYNDLEIIRVRHSGTSSIYIETTEVQFYCSECGNEG